MESILARIRRTSELGILGEALAAEALYERGFDEVRNLNAAHTNHPFADLFARKGERVYFVGVKTRNEERDVGGLNDAYNCVLVKEAANRRLKAQGKTPEEITSIALEQVHRLAAEFNAIAAWITVPVRADQRLYAAFFGLLSDLGNRRSIPMTARALPGYECLVDWRQDSRITPELSNRR